MKKVTLIVGIIIGMLSLNSCTDNTLEEVENREQQRVQFIDKDEIENPRDKDN
ncbi:hypothetical protein T190115A13A_460005 [Tenacibaculum sp. 190524A02b]|uniref:Lipoprotein n=1 Tax=Tenacibaculum vairaonense TaxID=3137860 RepID=A0ABP1FGY6_9FLAO